MLYLALDNSLQDCSDLPSGDCNDTEMVQDYKKMSKKITTAKARELIVTKYVFIDCCTETWRINVACFCFILEQP